MRASSHAASEEDSSRTARYPATNAPCASGETGPQSLNLVPRRTTLTAAGATRRTRRSLAATTAAALAGLGVALATAGAGVVLTVGYLHGPLNVPVASRQAMA